MRRKDREMPREFALEITDKCEWATLCMTDAESNPYGVPITIVRDGSTIYFHSAAEGFKTECLRNCGSVCMVCVGHTHRPADNFTTEFESAIIRGAACEVTGDHEKLHALRLLCIRHTPTNMQNFDSEVKKHFSLTSIWKIEILSITGKRNKHSE